MLFSCKKLSENRKSYTSYYVSIENLRFTKSYFKFIRGIKMILAEKKLEYVNCNLCGSKDYNVMYEPTKKDYDPTQIFSASGGVMGTQHIVRCKECGLVYVNPRVEEELVIDAYSNAEDELYVSQADGRQKTFKKALKLVERFRPSKGKILDVGCAAGFFLNVAKKSGWETFGVEPSKWLGEWGNKNFGLNIVNGVLKEGNFKEDYFDVVTMWDVLEHTPDPISELKEVNRVLKKDGVVIINFPDVGSWMAKAAGRNWWFFLSVHLYHFTPKTLTKMLEKSGLRVISVKPHIQTLGLGHLVKMIGLYNKFLSNIALKAVNVLRLTNLQIPYYASQTNIIAKKI